MSSAHFLFIPAILLIGLAVGWVLGSRAAADEYAAKARRDAERVARRATSDPLKHT